MASPNTTTPASATATASSSETGFAPLAFAVGGLVLCCFPIGLVGVVKGHSLRKQAKEAGRSAPAAATLAVILGGLSVLSSLGMIAFGTQSYLANQGEIDAMNAGVEKERSADVLAQNVACTLAQVALKKRFAYEAVECKTPLAIQGKRAVLANVEMKALDGKKSAYTMCFAKSQRWFVLDERQDGECSSRELPAKLEGLPQGNSPEQLEEAEDLYRKDEQEFQRALRIVQLEQSLADIRQRVKGDAAPEACPDFSSLEKKEITYLESAYLSSDKKGDEAAKWNFMTKSNLRKVLANEGSNLEQNETFAAMTQPPILAVFVPEEDPVWPTPGSGGFNGGTYEGRLWLFDTAKKTALCSRPFAFESGETISVRRSKLGITSKSRMEDKLAADFEEHFEDAATALLTVMSKDQLKLGMSWLD
ncbi:MAG TPA: hypothetical protein VLC09_16320 [Polyangiaceae bacterium]|nr:hypothetical protein [Polyangiaceae bacterium]